MKSGYLIMLMVIFCPFVYAVDAEPITYASDAIQSMFGTVQLEAMEEGNAFSLGFFAGHDDIVYGGFSLNYISSSTVIQHSDRKDIYPVYMVFGIKQPSKISPFIEVGVDLAEIIIEDMLGDEEIEGNEIDFYHSAGLQIAVDDKFSISVYAKRYYLYFREDIFNTPLKTSIQNSYGVGAIMHF